METRTFHLRTPARTAFMNITHEIQTILDACPADSGLVTVFTPHTTAALTINENADPDVVKDLSYKINDLIPKDETAYRHGEGNSDSHLKSSLFSPSLTLVFENRRCLLGIWQAVYFCEFDGPRTRTVHVKIIEDK